MKKATGISISEKFLRIAEIEEDKEKLSIRALKEFPIPEEGSRFDKKNIVSLKKTLKQSKIFNKAFIAPDDRVVIVKDKTLPPVKPQEIFKIIETEIKDYAIFNHENVSLGYNIINKGKDKIKILWAGIKENTLFHLIRSLKHIGIKPIAFVPSNFALTKFINYFYKNPGNFVIINVEDSITTLTFVSNNKAVLTFTHDSGLKDLSANDLSLRNSWVGSIVTTLTFVARNRSLNISKVFLISDRMTNELLSIVSARISYPVIIPDISNDVKTVNEEDFLRIQKTGGLEFAEAIGLALIALNGKNDPLYCDISKHILVEKASTRVKLATTIILLFIINGAAIYFYPYLNNTLTSLNNNLQTISNKIKIVSKEAENTQNLKNEISALQGIMSQYKVVESDLNNRAVKSALLKELKDKLPDGVEILSTSIAKDGNISITGVGKSYSNVLNYEINLANAQFIEDASILNMAQSGQGIVVFNMSAEVKGVSNEKK